MYFIISVLRITYENSWDEIKFWCSESLSLIYRNKCMYNKEGLIIIGLNIPQKNKSL